MNSGTIVQALAADAEYREVNGLEPLAEAVAVAIRGDTE